LYLSLSRAIGSQVCIGLFKWFFAGQSFDICGIRRKETMAKTALREENALTESEEVFEKAADLFRVMSAPMRLRIISALCNGEKNVGELLAEILPSPTCRSTLTPSIRLACLASAAKVYKFTTASSTTVW
jgi:hypothetical protein